MPSEKPLNCYSLYPQVIESNPEATSPFLSNPDNRTTTSSSSSSSPSSSLYPKIDMTGLATENLFPDSLDQASRATTDDAFESSEEVLITIPGAMVHLIDSQQSIELACGEFTIVGLRQGDNVVAVLARVGDQIQWPLAKDEAVVKLDDSHYFFTLRLPKSDSDNDEISGGGGGGEDNSDSDNDEISDGCGEDNLLNYGLTIATKGQEKKLKVLDEILEKYSAFRLEKVSKEVEGWVVAKETSPEELENEKKKELVEESSAAFWTTLAPNVEDYSGSIARMIAAGSGQVIKGILWCGDVTVDQLRWGNEFLKKGMGQGTNSYISPRVLKRMKRVKKLTKMSEKVAAGVLSGVVKVSGFFTGAIANSVVGRKFFSLLPGEIVLASLDGFNRVWDAVEVAGRNVMSTTSTLTTSLVSQKYGEQAGQVTHEGLGAAGHAIDTAWAVFKIRKALNPKSVIKPTTLVKAAAEANSAKLKAKNQKSS